MTEMECECIGCKLSPHIISAVDKQMDELINNGSILHAQTYKDKFREFIKAK